MAINRISGNILQDNLQRGANLSVQGNLIFFDVDNSRVGFLNSAPAALIDAAGDIKVGNTTIEFGGNIVAGNAWINHLQNPVADTDAATKQYVDQSAGNVSIDITDGVNVQTVMSGNTVLFQGNVDQLVVTVIDPLTVSFELASNVSVTGTVGAGNINALGNISAADSITANVFTANVFTANLVSTVDAVISNTVTANNVTSTVMLSAAAANITGTLTTAAIQGNNGLIITSVDHANIEISPGTGLVIIDSTTGLTMPVGNTAQRPGMATAGTIRYNVDTERAEIYDGAEWDQVVSDVTAQIITPDGFNTAYTLDRISTAAATLVAINGILQLPAVAYTVSGNVITFAEPPLTTDIVDCRFL